MKLKLQTLSPVHIGTGEELAPMEYIVHNKNFYRVTEKQFTDWVDEILPEDIGLEALSTWISEETALLRDTRDNRELSKLNGNMNPHQFFVKQGKKNEFERKLQTLTGTPVIFDRQTERRFGRSSVANLGQIRGMIKNATGNPIIPGSSIKGSLRTALFYHYLTQHADSQKVASILRNQKNRRSRKERFDQPLVQEAFYCGTKDMQRNRFNGRDEKMDLMKLVRIPDAHMQMADSAQIHLAKINIYLVETQKPRHSGDKSTEKLSVQQPQASYCEIIPMGQSLETEIDFDIDFLLQVKPFLQKDGIQAGKDQHWIGLETKVLQLFGLDLSTLNSQNKEEKKQEVISHLMTTWKTFSARQLKKQDQWLAYFKEHDRNGWSQQVEKGYQPINDSIHTTLLHLGYGTGFAGTTALLYFLQDQNLSSLYKQILEGFNIGNKPRNRGQYSLNLDRFPKSRRLVEDEDYTIRPLGWMQWTDDPDIGKQVPVVKSRTKENIPGQPKEPVKPTFFSGTLNYKKPPLLDAVVVRSGRPNQVQVYLAADKMPVMNMNGYRNPLDEGTIVVVQVGLTKKGEVVQVSFKKIKK